MDQYSFDNRYELFFNKLEYNSLNFWKNENLIQNTVLNNLNVHQIF